MSIKVLAIASDNAGCGKYRTIDPHRYLDEHYSDFSVDITDNLSSVNPEEYNIVHFHRTFGKGTTTEQQIASIKSLRNKGVVVVMDIDDYWDIPLSHPSHRTFKEIGYKQSQISLLKSVDWITTTTPIFAKEIKKLGLKNVTVISNSIDPTEHQFSGKTEKNDLIRFGWLGGSSHTEDIKLLHGSVNKLNSNFKGKFQFVLCGYDTRGTAREMKNGKVVKRPIRPTETSWFVYENVVTDKFKILSREYVDHLLKFNRDLSYDDKNEPYRRVWTEPINKYALNYTKFDVSLAPLVVNTYNQVKSELKAIEAGFYKKALIAQDIDPYNSIGINAWDKGSFNDKGNMLLVSSKKNHKDWFNHMKRLMNNPSLIEDLGERLYETVKDKFHLKTTTEIRKDLYKKLNG